MQKFILIAHMVKRRTTNYAAKRYQRMIVRYLLGMPLRSIAHMIDLKHIES